MKNKCKNCERIRIVLEKILDQERKNLFNLHLLVKEVDAMMMKCPVNQIQRFRMQCEDFVKKETYVKEVIKELEEILKNHNKK